MEKREFELSELRTDEFFEHFAGPAAFLLWDGEHAQIVRANSEYAAELGMDHGKMEKLDLLSLLDEPYRRQYRNALSLAAETGREQSCESLRHVFSQCCGLSDIWVGTRLRRVGSALKGWILFASVRNITHEKQLFESVSESDRRFRYAAEQANVYAWEYTIDTRQMRPCYRCMRDLGLPALLENYPEPAIEMGIFPPDYADMYREWHQKLEQGAEHLESVIPLTAQRIPFHVRYTTVFDGDGKPVKAYGSATQVTESEKEREYRNIIGSLSRAYFCLYYIDLKSGEYRQLNSPSLGVVNEAIGQAGKAADAFESMSRRLVVPEQMAEILKFTDISTLSERLKNRDTIGIHFSGPHVGWCEGLFVSAKRDAKGCCTHAIWGVRSIQQEKEKEEQYKQKLKEAKEMAERHSRELREQLDIIASLASTFASIYYIDMLSLEFLELGKSGELVESFIGSRGNAADAMEVMCRNIVASSQAEEMREFSNLGTLNERLRNDSWISRQFQAGSGRWNEGIFIAAKRDAKGNCLNVIWAIRDINEMKLRESAYQKELEEARDRADAANKAKTSFLFNMSHDIRTPMNAIIGYTDLIEKHYDDKDRCMDYLHKTQQSNRFLLSLINDVLEMARIESGKARLEETVTRVGGVARELSAIFEDQMAKKGISYESHVETHTEYAFYDQAKIREIYLNILSNALKYTPAGGKVSMRVEELPSDRSGFIRMKAVFSDTGIGMSKEFLPHLFEEFSRERTATESRQQGTGLGMPIVKKIIDLMGGTIDVQSELGKGSTFTVTYPLKTKGAEPDDQEEPCKAAETDFHGKRLLLAEDNDLNAEIAMEILAEEGFEIDRAEDGQVCIEKLKAQKAGYYDAILMDIQMPNMDGYTATRTIRAMQDPGKNRIPIVAMTANAFESDRQDALKAGMNGHIAKPIEISKLREMLAGVLKLR